MKEKSNLSADNEKLKKALIKKALGYDATEVVEEYVSGEEGEIKLTKKKVTKKNVPPDLTALKMLIDETQDDLAGMSDNELEEERVRLLGLLVGNKEKKEQKSERAKK